MGHFFLQRVDCKEWRGFPQVAKVFKLVKGRLYYEAYKCQYLIIEQNIHKRGDVNEASEQNDD